MRVGIDLTPLRPVTTGVDVYMLELVKALARLDGETAYTVFVNVEDRRRLGALPGNFHVVPVGLRPRPVRLGVQQAVLPFVVRAARLDVLHSPSFFLPLAPVPCRHVLTVHDLTFITDPLFHTRLRRSGPFRKLLLASIRRADRILVPSAATASSLEELLGEETAKRTRPVPLGVSDRFRRPPPRVRAEARDRLGLTAPYLLHVGTHEPRKNIERLLRAYDRAVRVHRVDEHLVLAGQSGWGVDLAPLLEGPELRGRVHVLGYVDDACLPALYASARAFVFPSRNEGFGLPPLEAMACGTPVLVSGARALRELTADGGHVVERDDDDALVDGILRVLRDEPLRRRLRQRGTARAAGLGWGRTARGTLATYREVVPIAEHLAASSGA